MVFRNISSPEDRLKSVLTNAIGTAIKNAGGFRVKNPLMHLSYTMEDLKVHLERQFEPWMTWDNWGTYNPRHKTWQIDHIIPQSSLPFTDLDDLNFQKCWDMSNLRPFETQKNLSKGNRQ